MQIRNSKYIFYAYGYQNKTQEHGIIYTDMVSILSQLIVHLDTTV